MAMSALIKIEQYVPVSPLLEDLFDPRIDNLELFGHIFNTNMQLRNITLDLGKERRNIRF